jgi:hypothetical protein
MGTRSASGQVVSLEVTGSITNTLDDGGTANAVVNQVAIDASLNNGVSADQANRAWEYVDVEITSGNTLDVDLRALTGIDVGAGSGKDALGQDALFEEIVCLIIHKSGGEGTLEINPTLPANPLTWLPLEACAVANEGGLKTGGVRMWFESDTDALDTSSSAYNVRFKAYNGDVTFDIHVLARHDDDESSSSSQSSSSSSSSQSSSGSSSSSSTSTSS